MNILRPRFVALDTSQLGNWARDRTSSSSAHRARAEAFEAAFSENDCFFLLSWHHFEELLGVEDPGVAADRLAALAAQPLVGWIRKADGEGGLGSIVDILATEALVASEQPTFEARAVRDAAKTRLINLGSGADALAPYRDVWRELQSLIWARAHETRAHIAVVQSPTTTHSSSMGDISGMKIYDLLKGRIREPDAASLELAKMQLALQRDVALHGDRRLHDPQEVAAGFFAQVGTLADGLPRTTSEFSERMLSLMRIGADEVGPDMTLAEAGNLMVFRAQLEVAADAANVPTEGFLRCVRLDQVPSAIIERALTSFSQALPERRGSDLIDRQLACIAPYADITFVDRRTKENLKRASTKDAAIGSLLGRVEKVVPYPDTVDLLAF